MENGAIYFDTTDGTSKVYRDGEWVAVIDLTDGLQPQEFLAKFLPEPQDGQNFMWIFNNINPAEYTYYQGTWYKTGGEGPRIINQPLPTPSFPPAPRPVRKILLDD